MTSIHKSISNRIETMDPGSIFSFEAFCDLGKYDTVKKAIMRIADDGRIVRIYDGYFMIPSVSSLTGEPLPPSIPAFANCIANKFCWSIAPCGESCLNILGISTQMPAKYEYLSDGPYRKYSLNGIELCFKHVSSSNIKNMSTPTVTLVQGIKTIGKDNLNDDVKARLRLKVSHDDRLIAAKEARYVTSWIYDAILDIAN